MCGLCGLLESKAKVEIILSSTKTQSSDDFCRQNKRPMCDSFSGLPDISTLLLSLSPKFLNDSCGVPSSCFFIPHKNVGLTVHVFNYSLLIKLYRLPFILTPILPQSQIITFHFLYGPHLPLNGSNMILHIRRLHDLTTYFVGRVLRYSPLYQCIDTLSLLDSLDLCPTHLPFRCLLVTFMFSRFGL